MEYRVTVGDSVRITNQYPDWPHIAEAAEERGYLARLESRQVHDRDIFQLLVDPTGWIPLGKDLVVSPWRVVAEVDGTFCATRRD